MTNDQVQAAARAERDKILPDLWNAIVKHTEGDAAFWLGEILLNEITKETGYTGQGSFASRATPADPALDPATVEAVEIARIVTKLRAEEGDSVTLFCDNPDFNFGANNAVEYCGWRTGWNEQRYEGETFLAALQAAEQAYDRALASGETK